MLENLKESELVEHILQNIDQIHASDVAGALKKLHKIDKEYFYDLLQRIPDEYLGEILLELPEKLRKKAYKSLSNTKITQALEELETDDATDIIQDLEDMDIQRADDVFKALDKEDQEDITWLKQFDEDVAGAYMQIELFKANLSQTIKESIETLRKLKEEDEIENIHQVFIVDDDNLLVASIALENLITYDFNLTYAQLVKSDTKNDFKPFFVKANLDIDEVVKQFEDYNLSVVAVTGHKNRLLGRITSDDIIDIVEQNATEQMYQLAGVDDESEQEEELFQTGKKRASWLFINLLTAIAASLVIGLFDETLKEYIALAILMPIVASMGGNAGTQTLAVMVRQLALGDIDEQNSKYAVKKEIFLSLFNGLIFALLLGFLAVLWFKQVMLGVVIAMSMIITLFCAGFFGSIIPLLLKKFDIDPAIGSTVVLTTVTDIMGFFSFLGLAKLMLV
ncbi:MAG: magnesium transporter [Campylobacterales bacterium]|nr:magnesium transporter [Campylobacterales bacterium]